VVFVNGKLHTSVNGGEQQVRKRYREGPVRSRSEKGKKRVVEEKGRESGEVMLRVKISPPEKRTHGKDFHVTARKKGW